MARRPARLFPAFILAGASALMLAAPSAAPVRAQSAHPTVHLATVDVGNASGGLRASRIIGRSVVNEAHEWVGEIDDIIIGADGKSPIAVLSVGGLLGDGARYVAVPYDQLKTDERRITLPGATKDAVMELPEFKYPAN